jgi:alcohol dehydrogenase
MAIAKSFFLGTRMVHGLGAVAGLAGHVKSLGGTKAFLCTDKGLTGAGVTERVAGILQAAEIPFVIFDDVPEDPGVAVVDAGVKLFLDERCDVMVAVGGGSPMCAGKGIALVAMNGGKLTDYEGFNKAAKAPYPVIAVPTTAGSGTEVSKVNILTDEARNFKMSFLDERTFPKVALLDGELMEKLPARPAIVAGMDALAHALDALWSINSTQISDSLATAAAATIFETLEREAGHAGGQFHREHRAGNGASRAGARPFPAAGPLPHGPRSGDRDHAAIHHGVQSSGGGSEDGPHRAFTGRERQRPRVGGDAARAALAVDG